MNIQDDSQQSNPTKASYLYGSVIRKYLVIAVGILIILAPIDRDLVVFYLLFGVICILVLIFLAAMTNAEHRSIILTDLVISAVMFVLFEYFALGAYAKANTYFDKIFILRQALSLIFLGTLYMSLRALAGITRQISILESKEEESK